MITDFAGTNNLQHSVRRLPTGVVADPHNGVGIPAERHDLGQRRRRRPSRPPDVAFVRHRAHRDLGLGMRLRRHANVDDATRKDSNFPTERGKTIINIIMNR